MLERAIAVFCLDPLAIGGLWRRGRASPVRDLVMAALRGTLPLPERRVQAGIGDEALYGGIALALTLASGRATPRPGLLAEASVLILPMAERAGAGLVDRLPGIAVPTLLIASAGDRAVPPKVSADAAARLPGAELQMVADYGHLPQEEAADGLASLILPWLLARLQPGFQPASA